MLPAGRRKRDAHIEVSDHPQVGTELAGYRIESLLGSGGMSVVYLAEDLRLKRRVALKLLAASLAEDESFRDRFLRESELAASIDHPNIVPIYEAGTTEGLLFIAMRYVEGRDLKERLRRGRLDPADAIGILAQVASALDAAHARGLVHRDVKPSNLLLDTGARPDGSDHVYLADFGLTKRVSEETGIGDDGHLMGTIDYVAPEQIAGEEIDGRADLYSLGCVLYECLVGKPPFRGDSDTAVVFAHLEAEPPPPSAHRPELPAALDAVIARALAKEPQRRYPSCRELARAALAVAVDDASRLLADVASRAAGGRSGLSEVEAELAGKVIDLQLAREQARALAGPTTPAGVSAEGICPFKGLASFEPADADYFFGRERLVAELAARLVGAGFLGIVGPSGSGKSSVLSAGLLPALAEGVLPGSERWRGVLLRPGERPLEELRRALESGTRDPVVEALDALPANERLLLAVDQLEELFTACRSEAERAAFADTLARAGTDPQGRAVVVVALRADFYGRFAAYPGLAELLGANQVLVGPMQASELRRVVELPAGRVGLAVEPELADALVDDVEGEPGALPLLSTALLELWQKRQDDTLVLASYRESGGVHGAVARLAEATYARIPDRRKQLVRAIMLRLVGEGEGDVPVRRRAPLAELDLERNRDVSDVLATLADSRLVTVGEGSVEVAHEALLREWPRLREWIEEDTEGRRLRRHITQAATEWDAAGRDQGELYRGARLAAALEWSADHALDLNELEREFVTESREVSEHETRRARRTNRRLRALLAGVAVLLAAALAGGIFAVIQRGDARDAAIASDAQRLGAEALSEDRLDRALLLANAGAALDDSLATRSSLLSTLLRSPAAIGVLNGDGDPFTARALSPDGGTLAVGDEDGTVTLFDTETREPIGTHQAPAGVWSLNFDPGGDSLALAGSAGSSLRSAFVEILDAETARVRTSIPLGRQPAGANLGAFVQVNYGPNGRSLIVTYSAVIPATADVFMRRFDARDGTPLGRAVRVAPRSTSTGTLSSPDWRLVVVSSDRATYAVDARTLRVVRRYRVGAEGDSGISADGGTLAVEDPQGGSLRLLDLHSGRVRTLAGAAAGVSIGALSPDGRTLATWDGSDVILWDVSKGSPSELFEGHDGDAELQVFSPDGRTLYTAGEDSRVIVWDVAGDRRLGVPFRTGFVIRETSESFPPSFAISPDGRTLAVARLDGRVDLIDAETLRRTGGFEAFDGRPAVAIEYAPDGGTLAVAGVGGSIGVWDAASKTRIGALLRAPRGPVEPTFYTELDEGLGNPHNVQALAFGQGDLLAAAEVGGAVRIWDVGRRELAGPPLRLPPAVLGLAFSPDGSRLAIPFGAIPSEDDGIEVRDVGSGERLARIPTDNEVRSAAFSPDGSLLAAGRVDGSALVWSTDGWSQAGQPLALQGASALGVAFSPDGRTLATSHDDGTVVLWDVASQQPIGPPLPGPADLVADPSGVPGGEASTTARFTPDGSRLFVLQDDGRAFRWEVDPNAWRQHACSIVGGGLAPEQWEEFLPGRPYEPACE